MRGRLKADSGTRLQAPFHFPLFTLNSMFFVITFCFTFHLNRRFLKSSNAEMVASQTGGSAYRRIGGSEMADNRPLGPPQLHVTCFQED